MERTERAQHPSISSSESAPFIVGGGTGTTHQPSAMTQHDEFESDVGEKIRFVCPSRADLRSSTLTSSANIRTMNRIKPSLLSDGTIHRAIAHSTSLASYLSYVPPRMMSLQRWSRLLSLLNCCIYLVVIAGPQRTFAFLPATYLSTRRQRGITLASSKGEDDELSKLISKRTKIKRINNYDLDAISTELSKSVEPTVDLDLDSLPESYLDRLPDFKVERPVRNAKSTDSDEGNDPKASEKKKEQDVPIMDFMAEYDDENDFHIPNRIGISTVSWGDPNRGFVSSGKLTKRMVKAGKFVPGDLQLAYVKLLQGGVTFMETSGSYGATSRRDKLSAEDILRRCMKEQPEDLPDLLLLETLVGPAWTKALSSKMIENQLQNSIDRLGTPVVELYQVPKSFLFPSTILANGLAVAIESGICNNVGVQGIQSARTLRRFCRKLEDLGVTLISNSFDFSLTNQAAGAVIDACKDCGVIPLITNPLDNGLASGVFTATNPSGGQAAGATQFSFKQLDKLQPLHSVQETIAQRVRTRVIREMGDTQKRFKSKYGPPPKINTDITTTQVALNYIIAKGGVPLPEVNNPQQADEVLGCLGWTLNDEEVDMLDAAAALCRLK
jgi:aryl-alcohol dehydrogenase-like predicted oxidoreductase